MLPRKLRMYFRMHGGKIAIIVAIIIVMIAAVIGLMSLESFYRNLTLATMPIQLILVALNAAIFVFMYLKFMQGGLSKGSATRAKGELVNVKWSDVIGMEDAKREAWEVVGLIKDRARLQKMGGKIMRGLLMIGPPGCGKTYLAKAIATEAGIPFLAMSGSSFDEVFIGVGSSKIRRLFKEARMLAEGHGGCIIFIDEMDSV